MKILGINGISNTNAHDSSICLIEDGKILDVIEEERLTYKRHKGDFPIQSIQKLLKFHNININDIDIYSTTIESETLYNYNTHISNFISDLKHIGVNSSNILSKLFFSSHHLAHLYNSFYQSSFDDAIAIINDNCGTNDISITIAYITNLNVKILKQFNYKESLGILYSAATEYIGYKCFQEGKLMGLQSFGSNNIFINIFNMLNTKNINTIEQMYQQLFSIFDKFYPYQKNNNFSNIMYYSNFASMIQAYFNERLLKLVHYAYELHPCDNLILGGGCTQNCVANNIICESSKFKKIYSAVNPHDGGLSVGYALHAALDNKMTIKKQSHRYSSFKYTLDDILDSNLSKIHISKINKNDIVNDLIDGKIIGWMFGESELGPRALGHRSIIANPAIRDNLYKINIIKNREIWRPLAPIVLDKHFNEVFSTSKSDLCEYMLRTLVINEKFREKLSAVCHVDNTTRPQLLKKDDNSSLYELIEMFFNKTHIPGLINTSFNINGQPIVETINDAINVLLQSKINYIIFNYEFKIEKRQTSDISLAF